MKIAYLSGAYIPSREANSVHVMRMCNAFATLGHTVTLHARRGHFELSSDFDHYGVPESFSISKHERPQVRAYGALANAYSVSRYYDTHPLPDIFYARELYALSALAHRGVPFVFESHWRPKHLLQKELERRLFRQPGFAAVVLISSALQTIYRALFPFLATEKIIVAHDGADPVVRPSSVESPASRLQVAYVGSLMPGRGIELVLALARSLPEMDFHIVGGTEADLVHWRTEARSHLNLRIHGFVAPNALSNIYPTFDIMLAPYQRGTLSVGWMSPMKLFEYMAHGKAIVSSDFPVVREILEHGVNAILVPAEDHADWKRALLRLRDASLRQPLGENARQKLEMHFTWQERAQSILAALRVPGLDESTGRRWSSGVTTQAAEVESTAAIV